MLHVTDAFGSSELGQFINPRYAYSEETKQTVCPLFDKGILSQGFDCYRQFINQWAETFNIDKGQYRTSKDSLLTLVRNRGAVKPASPKNKYEQERRRWE